MTNRTVKGALVLTTIYDPIVLDSYYQNFLTFGHLDDVMIIVIPDRKTPSVAYDRCLVLRQRGMNISCPTLDEQEEFLRRVGFPPHLIPYNSDNRRNIGYLMALEAGVDFLISMDDDNYITQESDFFNEHAVVCNGEQEHTIIDVDDGWFNVCSVLETDLPNPIYARGFPYYARNRSSNCKTSLVKAAIHMNAGLWLKEPDLDGITWLVAPTHSVGFKNKSLVLGSHTWSPINTQNTALHRDVIPSFYYIKMGYPLSGMPIDRYGDIFSGYFSQTCVKHLGKFVRVGTPLVEHRRHSHNYLSDATNELACILVMEDLLPWLTELNCLNGNTYPEVYTSLSYAIEDEVEAFSGKLWTDVTRAYFHQMAYYMRRWVEVCNKLN